MKPWVLPINLIPASGHVIDGDGEVIFVLPPKPYPMALVREPQKLVVLIEEEQAKGFPDRRQWFERIFKSVNALNGFSDPAAGVEQMLERCSELLTMLIANAMVFAAEINGDEMDWAEFISPSILDEVPILTEVLTSGKDSVWITRAFEMITRWKTSNPGTG